VPVPVVVLPEEQPAATNSAITKKMMENRFSILVSSITLFYKRTS